MVMLAEPLDKLAVGVKTAVRVKPVPLMAPKVPPDTVKSPAVPFHAKLVLGSSVKVNVMVAVSPIFSDPTSVEITTVGAAVSMEIEGEVPADPVLPATSE
jgi:hypothetical protein